VLWQLNSRFGFGQYFEEKKTPWFQYQFKCLKNSEKTAVDERSCESYIMAEILYMKTYLHGFKNNTISDVIFGQIPRQKSSFSIFVSDHT